MITKSKMFTNDLKRSVSYNLHTTAHNKPHIIVIETTNYCNLNCKMCPRRNMTRKLEHMKLPLFKKIVDECHEFAFDIGLDLFGEPLLCPDIFEMIKYAKSKGVTTSMSTNAVFLTEENGRKILESGLDLLVIDFDGATKKTYEGIRAGANYSEVVKNIKNFAGMVQRYRDMHVLTLTKVIIQLIRMKETEPEIKQWIKMWQYTPFQLYIKRFNTWANQDAKITNLSKTSHRIKDNIERFPCSWLWEQMIFQSNGNVVPCCLDYDGKLTMGNIKRQSVIDIWNGAAYKALRKAHIDKKYIGLCKDCTEWKGHQRFRFWEDMKVINSFSMWKNMKGKVVIA